MDGVSIAKEVAGVVSVLGLVPTLAIVCISGFFLYREMLKKLNSIDKSISSLRQHSDERDKEIFDRLENAETEIKIIEKEVLTKEQHYRDFEGWKTELHDLRSAINEMPMELIKLLHHNGGR